MTHAATTLINQVLNWTYVAFLPTMLVVLVIQLLIHRKN